MVNEKSSFFSFFEIFFPRTPKITHDMNRDRIQVIHVFLKISMCHGIFQENDEVLLKKTNIESQKKNNVYYLQLN